MRDAGEFEAEARMRRTDGAWRSIHAHGVPRRDDDGRVIGMVGSSTDITERRRYEQELSEDARRKDEFLAMLAHELRNPLAPIRSAVDLLRLTGGRGPSMMESSLGVIDRQVAQLVRLVDDLLDMARVSMGRITLQREILELSQVVQQALETTRPLIDARRHRLVLALPEAPMLMHGDATRLAQALGNVIINAAKYTEPGGSIEISLQPDDDGHALIRVRDNGRGIDAAEAERLFTMFYQASGTLERADGGLGIGLALVRRLVEMHDGSIDVHSEGLARGSEFVIRLPRLAPEACDALYARASPAARDAGPAAESTSLS